MMGEGEDRPQFIQYVDSADAGLDTVDGVAEGRHSRYKLDNHQLESVVEMLNRRFTIPILCSMLKGTTRFNALSREHNINPKTLGQRLKDLEVEGLIAKAVVSPRVVTYGLTAKGLELATIFEKLQRWMDHYDEAPIDKETTKA